jgi:hypothetical protein
MIERLAVLGLFCSLVLSLLSYQQKNAASQDDLIVKARAFLDALSRKDFEAAARTLTRQ